MKFHFLLLPCLLLLARSVAAQHYTDTIPFLLVNKDSNIVMMAALNKADTAPLMFHTAVSGISVMDLIDQRAPMTWSAPDTVQSWGGRSATSVSHGNHLLIGNQAKDSLTIWKTKHSGHRSLGKFGPDFFDDYLIEIDYDDRQLILHEQLPKLGAEWTPVKLTSQHGMWFVEGTFTLKGKQYANRFLVHSGFGGALLLDDKFARKHKLAKKLPIHDSRELKDSYGNTIVTLQTQLPEFQFGTHTLEQVDAEFFDGTIGRQQMSVMGCAVLSQFNLLIDAEAGLLYLNPRNGS